METWTSRVPSQLGKRRRNNEDCVILSAAVKHNVIMWWVASIYVDPPQLSLLSLRVNTVSTVDKLTHVSLTFSYITQIHSKLFATSQNGLSPLCLCSLLHFFFFFFCPLSFVHAFIHTHFHSSVCSPIPHHPPHPYLSLSAVDSLFPAGLSVQTQSSTSQLSRLFKDGCAGWQAAGWSDGLWR